MATRLLFVSVPKSTRSMTKPSQRCTPFSAVAVSPVLRISKIQTSTTLETIYEEEANISGERIEAVAEVLASASPLPPASNSFLLSNRSTCLVRKQRHLSKHSDNFRCAQGSN